jgi:hypothetical protein
MKKVSVIIPVYGVEKYVADAVSSVLQQSYINLELIIVDNGSPDRSIEICQQFHDPRIQIIRQENRGPSGSRNTGIRHAKGDYIAFLDGDDIWHPDKLTKHVHHLESDPQLGISFCYSAFIDIHGRSLGLYMTPKLKNITPEYILCRCPMSNGSVSVYRREVFEEIAFGDDLRGYSEVCYFNERLKSLEDVECWTRMALKTNWGIEGIPEPLTQYRLNDQGSSANVNQQLEYVDKLIEKLQSYAPDFSARWEKPFRANQLRFLARRMVSLGQGKKAVELINRALVTHHCLLQKREFKRTLVTVIAAYMLLIFPKSLCEKAKAFYLAGAKRQSQKQLVPNFEVQKA